MIRGRGIVLEEALEGGLRFSGNVDLVTLARMACKHQRVPESVRRLLRAATRPCRFPNLVSGLSLLVAGGILHERR